MIMGAPLGRDGALFQRSPSHRRQFAHDEVGRLAGNRQLALALEFLDGGLCFRIDDPARPDLAIAVFGKRPLQRDDALRWYRPSAHAISSDWHRTCARGSCRRSLRQLGWRSHDGLQQCLVRLRARLERGSLFKVPDFGVRHGITYGRSNVVTATSSPPLPPADVIALCRTSTRSKRAKTIWNRTTSRARPTVLDAPPFCLAGIVSEAADRKSTRLNSSHVAMSY